MLYLCTTIFKNPLFYWFFDIGKNTVLGYKHPGRGLFFLLFIGYMDGLGNGLGNVKNKSRHVPGFTNLT